MKRPARTVLLTIALACVRPAWADLAAMDWQQLLASSDLVVLATATDLRMNAEGGGSARLLVSKVLRGRCLNHTVGVAWGLEVHDQRIDRLGARYVLFLKHTKQGYTAAGYGRSYWPIESSYSPEDRAKTTEVVFYRYPITEVLMPPDMVVTVPQTGETFPEPAMAIPAKAILLSALTGRLERTH